MFRFFSVASFAFSGVCVHVTFKFVAKDEGRLYILGKTYGASESINPSSAIHCYDVMTVILLCT